MIEASILSLERFQNPAMQFRPLQIIHEMDRMGDLNTSLTHLAQMGTGWIVTNVGFEDYLTSPEQWENLRKGIEKAAGMGFRIWLYDEKGYPSGTAGGMVTRANPELVVTGIACYRIPGQTGMEVCFPLPQSCKRLIWVG